MISLRPMNPEWSKVIANLARLLATASLVLLVSCAPSRDKARSTAMSRGQQYYQKANYAAAEIQFEKAIQQDANFGQAWLWLGRTEEQLGKTTGALVALKQAVTLMPGQAPPLTELGNFLLVAYVGDPRHPAEVYKQISEIADQLLSEDAESFEGTKLRGFLAASENDSTKAVSLLQKANKQEPGDASVVTALFESLMRSGQKEQAEKIALEFLSRRPDYGPLYTMLGQYYLQSGRKNDAEAILKTKVARNPKEGLYRVELARYYSRTGRAP